MTWLTDEDRKNAKRFTAPDAHIPEHTYIFRDKSDGSTIRKRLKNGSQYDWAKKHGFEYIRMDY